MASIIKADTLQSTTANVFVLNSSGTEYARFDSSGVFQLANPTTFPAGTVSLPSITATGDTNTGLYFPAADTIAFSEGGVESMRIDSSGNMGIGTASPGAKLDIVGGSNILGLTNTSASGYEAINMTVGTQQARIVLTGQSFGDANYGTGDITIQAQTTGKGIRFGTNGGTNQMILDSAGLLTLSSGQIKFPASQNASADANTLDDYEEGTWTPSVGGTATYGTRIAHYTKIGDTVRAFFDISIGTIGTGSLTTLSGFPFTCTNNDSGCISYFAGLGATVYFIQIQMSGTNCIFVGLTAAGATVNNGMNVFTTGARIIGTVVYKTTT